MRPILYTLLLLLLLFFLISFHLYKNESFAEKITINGTVSDTDKNLLDSVYIYLMEGGGFGVISIPIIQMYSEKGIFKIEFIPEEEYPYFLILEKKGYRYEEFHGIDKKEEFLNVNIIMEREAENEL
jgi:hypothetical protein